MGSVIHMDTEQVRSVAKQLSQVSSDIQQDIISVGNRLRGLNWQSPSRDRFISDVAELQRKVQIHAELGAELGLRMQKEADEWERVDNSWPDTIVRAEEYDWLTWTTTALGLGVDGGVDLIKYLTTIPLKDYRQTGRILNELFETRGWVGDMDDLGHLIKGVDGSKFFDAVFEGLPVGIEIFDDLGHGDSWQRSVDSEVLEYALEEGIKLVPVIGTAYLVYDFLLDIGGITSG
ncbi:MAG TPA: hypothetical protein PLL95_18505, partial [Anaerolineales bacterium]|nr:hypothetical protein [Anaerolineales bacterium]